MPQATIHNSIKNFLEAKYQWENTLLRVKGNEMYICKNNYWELVEEYEPKPIFSYAPKPNPDGKNINCGVVPHKQKPKIF